MTSPETITFPRRETTDPVTGRRWTQLTCGADYCYPLYYFGPTVTADGGTLLFYRYREDEVQNWKLDLATGAAVRLTAADTPNCLWRFWDEDQEARGVRELMSAFSQGSEELLYFDGNVLHAVNVRSLADRAVYELPGDRVPCGIPGASPDGERLVFVHADRTWWEEATLHGPPVRHEAHGVRLDVVELTTGHSRNLVTMDSWLTHANFYDDERILFANHPTEPAVLMTDLRGGWYTHLRTQTTDGWVVNHYLATERGIMYETVSPGDFGVIGICDPVTYAYQDFRTDHPIHHVGHDPEGRLWLGDIYRTEPTVQRFLAWLPRLQPDRLNEFVLLTQGFNTYGRGQRSHLHPVLLPNRQHLLFTGPDHETQTNHIFMLDVSDLPDTMVEDGTGAR